MTDGLEELLRDHYRRAAEHIQPDPDLIRRAKAAGRIRRRSIRWPVSASIAAVATAATAAAALVFAPTVRTSSPGARPVSTQGALTIGLQADRTTVETGARVRLTGDTSAAGLLTIFIEVSGQWRAAGAVQPANGHYTAVITVTSEVTALRLCSGSTCSARLPITVIAASPMPYQSPSRNTHPRPSDRPPPAKTPVPGSSPPAASSPSRLRP